MTKAFSCSLLVAGMMAFVGCGGSDTTTVSGASGASGATGAQGAALTKQQFIAKADAICKKGNQAVRQAGQKIFQGKPSQADLTKFAEQTVIPSIQEQVTAIAALPAPKGDEDRVKAIVDAAQQGLAKAKQDPSVITQQNSHAFDKANQLANSYGLKVCGRG